MIHTSVIENTIWWDISTKGDLFTAIDVLTLALYDGTIIDIAYKKYKNFIFDEKMLDYMIKFTPNYDLILDIQTLRAYDKQQIQ